jgi:hypothetical protein
VFPIRDKRPDNAAPFVPEENSDHFHAMPPAQIQLRFQPSSNPSRRRRCKAVTSIRLRVGGQDTRAPYTPASRSIPHREGKQYPLSLVCSSEPTCAPRSQHYTCCGNYCGQVTPAGASPPHGHSKDEHNARAGAAFGPHALR